MRVGLARVHEEICFAIYDWLLASSALHANIETRAWGLITIPHICYLAALSMFVLPDPRSHFKIIAPVVAVLVVVYGVWFDKLVRRRSQTWGEEFSSDSDGREAWRRRWRRRAAVYAVLAYVSLIAVGLYRGCRA